MIYIPSKEIITDLPELKMGIEGYFTLRAIRKSGRVTRERRFKVQRQTGPFHNVITTLGLNRLGSASANANWSRCHVGTGTATPAFSDTQLATFLANVLASNPQGVNSGNSGSPDFYSWLTMAWTSAIGALGNNNLTELGISGQNANGNLFSRELIRDSGGNPTSFPIASDEQLQVTYELRVYPKLADTLATVTISGQSHDTITRPLAVNSTINWRVPGPTVFDTMMELLNMQAYSGYLVAPTAAPNAITGMLGTSNTASNSAYVNDSFQRDSSAVFALAQGNGNIRSVTVAYRTNMLYQVRYDPVIVKNNTQLLTLNHRVSWARR